MSVTHGNTTSVTWNSQSLGELIAIGDISLTADTVDASTYNAADKFKVFTRGLIDGGELTITCNFDQSDTGQAAFVTDFYAGTSRNLVVTFPTSTGTTWTVPAIPTGLGTAQPMDGNLAITLTMKVTGKPTFATTASNNVTALTVTTATLYPTFAQGTYSYVGTSTGTGLTFTPTFAAGTCSITNGTSTVVTTSTVASGSLALGASGTQTTFTMTITETGKAPKIYTFVIAKTA